MAGQRFTGFPLDGNDKPVMSSTKRVLVVIDGDGTWKDVVVPAGSECKAAEIVVHTMDATNYANFLPPGEYHYRPDSSCTSSWIPKTSGPVPWAGKENAILGQVRAATGTKISILMMA